MPPHLDVCGSFLGEAIPQDANIQSGPPNIHHNSIVQTREEGRSPHAVGWARGEGQDRTLHSLFSTKYNSDSNTNWTLDCGCGRAWAKGEYPTAIIT